MLLGFFESTSFEVNKVDFGISPIPNTTSSATKKYHKP